MGSVPAIGRPRLLERMEFFTDGDRPMAGTLPMGSALKMRIHFNFPEPVESFDVGIGFDSVYGQRVFTAHSSFEPERDGVVDDRAGRIGFDSTRRRGFQFCRLLHVPYAVVDYGKDNDCGAVQ